MSSPNLPSASFAFQISKVIFDTKKAAQLRFFSYLSLTLFLLLGIQLPSIHAQEAPVLQCANRIQGSNNNILLTWDQASNSSCGTSFEGYYIFVATDKAGPYTELAVITDPFATTYTDNSPNSSAAVLYYFIQESCAGILSAASDTLDTNPPVAPQIISVTVTPNVSSTSNDDSEPVLLSWRDSPSPEATGLIIYRANVNGSFEPIDTIYDIDIGFYIDSTATPDFRPMAYKIAALDGCISVPGPDNGQTHQTIQLSANSNGCLREIELNWTRYLGWDGGVKDYEITDGNQLLGTVDGTTETFVYSLPEGESQVCLRVVATRNSNGIDNSNSNEICVDVNETNSLEYLCLKNVSVAADGSVNVTWSMDTINEATSIEIYREVNDSSDLQFHKIAANGDFEAEMTYADIEVATERDNYFYQVVHTDDCDRELRTSVGSPVLLKGLSQFDLTNRLEWSPFVLTGAIIQNYVIYRKNGVDGEYTPISTVDESTLNFLDDGLSPSDGAACYYIETKFTWECNGEGEALSSRSNELCVLQASRIFLPNAFAPNSPVEDNRVFKPLILYPNAENYSMMILNRWGELVFETTVIDEAWDGFHNGKLAAQGVYLYRIEMRTETGFLIERKGSMLLVR